MFLAKLLSKEYVLERYLGNTPGKFEEVWNYMLNRGMVSEGESNSEKNQVGSKAPDSNIFLFNCSLIWPTV